MDIKFTGTTNVPLGHIVNGFSVPLPPRLDLKCGSDLLRFRVQDRRCVQKTSGVSSFFTGLNQKKQKERISFQGKDIRV